MRQPTSPKHGRALARLQAILALAFGAATLVLAVLSAWMQFPRGLIVLASAALALFAALFGLVHRGGARIVGLVFAGALAGACVALLFTLGGLLPALVVVGLLLTLTAARAAFRVHVALPPAPRPQRAVLFYNPRSGGGKAERYALASEARSRGIEPVELAHGEDLETLVRDAVSGGADALAMAGGDGSQAIVAAVAAEHSLPYACVPAGTRNHFALDLGVDRDDVVGALDALVDGGQRVVDLAEVNGRVFVNNVSLGMYADAVQRPEYRNAKLRTLLDTIPDEIGPDAEEKPLRWTGPDGARCNGQAMLLVSNNRYRLGKLVGSMTRPRLDEGLLGVTVVGESSDEHVQRVMRSRPWREWGAQSFAVEAAGPLAAGIDGEAVQLETPLRFSSRPSALKVRIARTHPGASPSAIAPDGVWDALRGLAAIAAGRAPRHGGYALSSRGAVAITGG
ncbi:MAG TPA: diacylglycerol kinase family protein [Solirubrobacteraceae bacterium]|nr:diacylglycerol kinase family protein [Solirubrobacteraceae bacterium]